MSEPDRCPQQLRQMGLEADDIDVILDFLGEARDRSEAERLLDAPFAAKPQHL